MISKVTQAVRFMEGGLVPVRPRLKCAPLLTMRYGVNMLHVMCVHPEPVEEPA